MHVPLPSFLSPMNQDNTLTWIFMGAPGPGASMHVCIVYYIILVTLIVSYCV